MAKEYSVYELNRIQQYIMQMRPVLKKEALLSDGTKDYRNPTEPEALMDQERLPVIHGIIVCVRFRPEKDTTVICRHRIISEQDILSVKI